MTRQKVKNDYENRDTTDGWWWWCYLNRHTMFRAIEIVYITNSLMESTIWPNPHLSVSSHAANCCQSNVTLRTLNSSTQSKPNQIKPIIQTHNGSLPTLQPTKCSLALSVSLTRWLQDWGQRSAGFVGNGLSMHDTQCWLSAALRNVFLIYWALMIIWSGDN